MSANGPIADIDLAVAVQRHRGLNEPLRSAGMLPLKGANPKVQIQPIFFTVFGS
jgi:hypothetical protein